MGRVARHDNAKRLTRECFLIYIFFPSSRCILPFFLDFSATSILPDERNIFFSEKTRSNLYCYEAQPCQMSLSNSQKPRCKNDSPAESITPWGSPRAQHIVLVPWQALLSTALAGVSFNSLGRRFFQQPWQAFLSTALAGVSSTALAGVSFNSLGRRFIQQPCTARRTKDLPWTSSPC